MKRSTKTLGLFAATAVVLGLAWVDTQAYRAAIRDLARPEMMSSIQAMTKDIETDAHRLWACTESEATDSASVARVRSCLIDALSKSKTTIGAIAGASKATMWLTTHPGDQEMQTVALIAIANGRKDMLASKEWNYDRFQNVTIAHDQSHILRFLDGRQNTSNMFERDADQLDQDEYAVLMPEVRQKQYEWRLKTLSAP